MTRKILAILDSFGLDCKKNLVAQCYDGASVMSGKNSGVVTRLQQIFEQAVYVHCHAHRLNLVLVDTAKSIREAADFFLLLQRLYVFFCRVRLFATSGRKYRKKCILIKISLSFIGF